MQSIRIGLAALTFALPATAGEWTQFSVSSTWSGQSGPAAKIEGLIYDSHGPRTARLVVSCVSDRTSVFLSADSLVFGGDIVRAEYRIDGGPAARAYWHVCAGDLCTGLWNGAGIPFVKSLLDAAVLKMTHTAVRSLTSTALPPSSRGDHGTDTTSSLSTGRIALSPSCTFCVPALFIELPSIK